MTMKKLVIPLAIGFAVLWMSVACQSELSEQDAARMVEAFMTNERYQDFLEGESEQDAARMVEALMTNERYQDFLEGENDDLIVAMTNAMMEHPSMQVTANQECATVILMAVVIAESYTVPPDSAKERLCDWYAEQMAVP